MVSSDDNFVCMRLTTKPCVEVDDLARRVSIGHEIARMNQDVAIGHAETGVLSVRVADTDDSHSCHRRKPLQSGRLHHQLLLLVMLFDFAFMIIETNPGNYLIV